MAKVHFVCDGKNSKLFRLSTHKDIDYIPMINDIIIPDNDDFIKASFRVKPYYKQKEYKNAKNFIIMEFKVISREYSLTSNKWTLICEPTPDCLLHLLTSIKV